VTAPAQTTIAPLGPTFDDFGDRIKPERAERLELASRILSFGVDFLDAALGGVFPRDMVLLGAKTGLGKTTLASIIAETNAEKGKRVHYFALEAEDKEIERRIKFRVLSQLVFKLGKAGPHIGRINYLDWYAGKLEPITGMYEAHADDLLTKKYGTLKTFYPRGDFTADDLVKAFLSIQDETDLIILDHIHMVDYDDANENRGIKAIVKKLRDVALDVGKPVVVVAHLRKTDRRSKYIVPDLDDFHGTSDLVKLVTKAVIIAPAYDQVSDHGHLWNTYIHPAKCRSEGSRTKYIGLVAFNVRTGRYEPEFEIGRATNNDEQFEHVPNDKIPSWAVRS
jgi:replicative DNA helicase